MTALNNSRKQISLLIFACPKPFVEPFKVIQQNAIKSWKQLKHPNVTTHIHLMGDEEGVEMHAKQLECTYTGSIQKNEFGTPLVDDMFKQIKRISREHRTNHPKVETVCCYINTDIIVFDELLTNIDQFMTAKHAKHFHSHPGCDPNRWLLIGTRWDTDNVPPIQFEQRDWAEQITQFAKQTGESHGCWGIDYFIFGPDTFSFIYPFALGKFIWDRWLVGNVFRQDSITVDITKTNFVIHQNGDWYQVCTGGTTSNRKGLFDTEEVKINQSFDYYEKDVSTGTQWETETNEQGQIEFIYKDNVPRGD